MKKIQKNLSAIFLGVIALSALVGCGGKKQNSSADPQFKFTYQTFIDGTTYKINLKGMPDGSATFKCAQAETPIDQKGTWKFDNNSGYTFDFGESFKVLCGYNAFSKSFYINQTVQFTAAQSERIQMTLKDESFQPSASYVDPYDAASAKLFKGAFFVGGEEIKLRDFGDGNFDLMSFGSKALFNYGTSKVDSGSGLTVYETHDGQSLIVEKGQGENNFRIDYMTESSDPFGPKYQYHNYLYSMSGDKSVDEAFPDPRGEILHQWTGTNTNEFKERVTMIAPGTLDAKLNLYKNAQNAQEYELVVLLNGDYWLQEKGTWAEASNVITLTVEGGASVLAETEVKVGVNFDYANESVADPIMGGIKRVEFTFTSVK